MSLFIHIERGDSDWHTNGPVKRFSSRLKDCKHSRSYTLIALKVPRSKMLFFESTILN